MIVSAARIRRIGVASVARVSVVFYLVMTLAFVVASATIGLAAQASGTAPSIDRFFQSVIGLHGFHLGPVSAAAVSAAGGLALTAVGTAANAAGALLYNTISAMVGGASGTVGD